MMFPPLPPSSGLHVLVVHFPIALLLVAPVFVLLAMAVRRHRMVWATAAATLMSLGTTAACVATFTGEAAEEGADITEAAGPVLQRHESLAELARNIFLGLTGAYVAFLLYNRFRRPVRHRTFAASHAVFLLAYAAGALVLANAAHAGGRLVHEFGVRSPTAESAAEPPAPATRP